MIDDLDGAAARRLARRHAREEVLDPESIYGSVVGYVIMSMLPRYGVDLTWRFLGHAVNAALVDWTATRRPIEKPVAPLQPRALYEETRTLVPEPPATTFALCRTAFVALSGLATVFEDPIQQLPAAVLGQFHSLAGLLGISVGAEAPATPPPSSDEPNAAS